MGSEGGNWQYWIDGTSVAISENGVYSTTETYLANSPYQDVALITNPFVGLYWTVPGGQNGMYIEGHIQRATVYALTKISPTTATASASYAGDPPSLAVDGNPLTQWNSGGPPTQWIEINLGTSTTVRKIRLLPSQSHTEATSHSIYIGPTPNPSNLVATVSGTTSDNVWVDVDLLEQGQVGQYVRVLTTQSSDWVAWREIEVYQ